MIAIILGGIIMFVAIRVFFSAVNERDRQQRAAEREKERQLELAEREKERQLEIINKKQSFIDILGGLQSVEVNINKSNIVYRQNLRDIPEIKFRNITKSFEKDSLPVFVAIDVETTGLNASRDRIIEVSAILFEDFEPVSYFSTLVNPRKNIPDEASVVNNIYDVDVASAPIFDEISESLTDFVGKCPIVGFNLAFDLKFLYCSGIDFISKRKLYDARALSKKAWKDEIYSFSLVNVAEYLDIYFDAHKSLNDCLATALVFQEAIEEIIY